MNTENYDEFGRARPSSTRRPYFEMYSFELESSKNSFYIALRDSGTCIGISRLRVYRYSCPAKQERLVLYTETPAPSSGSVDVSTTCVENSYLASETSTVQCHSNGTWGEYVPVCKCRLGYEDKVKYCSGKSVCYTGWLHIYWGTQGLNFHMSVFSLSVIQHVQLVNIVRRTTQPARTVLPIL